MSNALTTGWATPKTIEEAKQIAGYIAATPLAGVHQGNPQSVFACMVLAAQLGITLMQAVNNIMVVNNRPTIWGDLLMELAKRDPAYVDFEVQYEGDGPTRTCVFTLSYRNGMGDVSRYVQRFGMADAKRAGLLDKKGSLYGLWTDDMLFNRARSRAIRRVLPGCTLGMRSTEEEQDAVATRKATVVPEGGSKLDRLRAAIVEPQDDLPRPEAAEEPPVVEDVADADWEAPAVPPERALYYTRVAGAETIKALEEIKRDARDDAGLDIADRIDVNGAIAARERELRGGGA